MNPSDRDTFRSLHAQALAGRMPAKEAAHLLTLCRQNPELEKEFGVLGELERLLPLVARDPGGHTFNREMLQRIQSLQNGGRGETFVDDVVGRLKKETSRRLVSRRLWVVGALLGLLILSFFVAGLLTQPVAVVIREEGAIWAEPPASVLRSGSRLRLQKGMAELRFQNGAEVLLEGPAHMEMINGDGARLDYGRVVARVGERGHGFYLEGSAGRVVDKGTAFGMEAHADGRMEVQVFEGEVEVTPKGSSTPESLMAHQKMNLSRGRVRKSSGASLHAFITALPPRFDGVPQYLHWRLDEGSGDRIHSEGDLAGPDPPPAKFRQFGPAASAPRWIDGVFGKALSFDGRDGAVETPFRGVAGDSPRTIAFWLRVPENFSPEQGYGVLSWGNLAEKGAAWQISVNPELGDTRLGRLRVGVGGSIVVGTTDLRDGQWHHCAIVLYPESYGRHVTQTLMYIDGHLEQTAGRSVMAVQTDVSEDARAVWMGRSLGHGQPDRESYGSGFFRGDMDEVYIFDAALGSEDILALYRHNRLPGPGK